MNALQQQFNQNIIKANREEIAKLERELQNPRIRNVQQRKDTIKSLQAQIEWAQAALAA